MTIRAYWPCSKNSASNRSGRLFWLNLIEAQFGVLKRFTLTDTDDRDHRARRRRIYRYLAYRHRKLGNLDHPLNHLRSFSNIKLE